MLVEDGEYVTAASALVHDDARAIIGVTINAASSRDEEVEVMYLGEIEDMSFNFIPLRTVFVDSNGGLTQTFNPSWRFIKVIGVAATNTKLMVGLRPPIFLAAA